MRSLTQQFDLDAFKAFVASKPASEAYPQGDPNTCALGQFGFSVSLRDNREMGISDDVYKAAAWHFGDDRTFGALASRLDPIQRGSAPTPEGDRP